MWKEFKEFASRGNVIDLAIGVIIGGAFQKIVTSIVNDLIMPTISIITGKLDFTDLKFTIGDVSISYGNFITSVIDFLIIAFVIFLIVRYINKLNKKLEEMPKLELDKDTKKLVYKKNVKEEVVVKPTVKPCPFCYSEINYNATRCPHCTSILDDENGEVSDVE